MKISIPIPNSDDNQPAGAQIIHADAKPTSAPPSFDIMTMFSSSDDNEPEVVDENPTEEVESLPETPPVPPTPPAPSPEDRLAQTTEALTSAVAALASASPKPAEPPVAPEAPKVWLTPEHIPQAMVQLLNSEDPAERVKGLAVFGNALVTMVYSQFQKDVQEQYQPQFQAMVQEQWQQRQMAQDFRNDLNTNYPVLVNSEQGKLVAQHLIQKVSASRHAAKKPVNWFDPDFRKDFDAELAAWKIDPKGKPAAAPTPAPQPTKVGRSNGARPVDPTPGTSTQQDHMAGMLASVFPRSN